VEKELQICAVAAFEAPASLNVVMNKHCFPVSVAGATGHVGQTKPHCRGSPVIKCRGSEENAGRGSACGSRSQLRREADSELHGAGAAPSGFARKLDLPAICPVLLRSVSPLVISSWGKQPDAHTAAAWEERRQWTEPLGPQAVRELSVAVLVLALSAQCVELAGELLRRLSIRSARTCCDVTCSLVPLRATLQLILATHVFGEQVGWTDLSSCRV